MNSMYEILMDLPLFQGVSRDKLSELIEKTPFHFLKYSDGEEIVALGDVCTHIKFVISGEVQMDLPCRNLRVKVSQVLSSPNVIGHDYLFGRKTIYPYNVISHGECGILQISKPDFINILHSDNIFLFNILNMLSRNSQNNVDELLSLSSGIREVGIFCGIAYPTWCQGYKDNVQAKGFVHIAGYSTFIIYKRNGQVEGDRCHRLFIVGNKDNRPQGNARYGSFYRLMRDGSCPYKIVRCAALL